MGHPLSEGDRSRRRVRKRRQPHGAHYKPAPERPPVAVPSRESCDPGMLRYLARIDRGPEYAERQFRRAEADRRRSMERSGWTGQSAEFVGAQDFRKHSIYG